MAATFFYEIFASNPAWISLSTKGIKGERNFPRIRKGILVGHPNPDGSFSSAKENKSVHPILPYHLRNGCHPFLLIFTGSNLNSVLVLLRSYFCEILPEQMEKWILVKASESSGMTRPMT